MPIEERAPSAPPELCAICERAMARKIEDRYPSMQAMARDLRAYLEGRVVGAYETGAVAEFKKWVRRNKALALTSLSAGVIIVSGLAIASLVLARKNTQLTAITAEAVASADLAAERAAKVLRLSDVKRLQQLAERAEALWPAHPSNAEPMRRWLASARDLLGREELHLAELARLRGLAGVSAGDSEGSRTFANTEDQWQHDTLVDLTADLDAAAGPGARSGAGHGGSPALRRERRGAEPHRPRGAGALGRDAPGARRPGPIPRLRRARARPAARPPAARPRPAFGALRVRAPADRRARAARCRGWASSRSPRRPAWSSCCSQAARSAAAGPPAPQGEEHGRPARRSRCELAPFFVSKYEMTQGQWLRITGDNPSPTRRAGSPATRSTSCTPSSR